MTVFRKLDSVEIGSAVGMFVTGFTRVLIEPRTKDADLLRQLGIDSAIAEILLAILRKVLVAGVVVIAAKVHRAGAALNQRIESGNEPQAVLVDRAADEDARLCRPEMIPFAAE